MRLVSVEMGDGEPLQFRFAEVVGHTSHRLLREASQVHDAVAVLWRNDEAEVMAILRPGPGRHARINVLGAAVEEVRAGAILPGAGARQIGDMRGQRSATLEPLSEVTRHQRLHDNALADIEPEGAA